MIAAVAVLALAATAAFGQDQSPSANTAGSGTAKALEQPGAHHMVGKPVSPSTAGNSGVSQRRKATPMPQRPGSVPANGSEKPAGTTGAPPYGSSPPQPNPPASADEEPHGG
jgi:hypothetical protein